MCVGWWVFRFQEEDREGTGTEGRGRERWSKEACVSVPLRVPRPGLNVGKVAHCLSHDPWGEAFFLLRSWMEMGHQIKPRKGATNITAHPNMHVMAESETLLLTVYVSQHTNHLIAALALTMRIIHTCIYKWHQLIVTPPSNKLLVMLLLCCFPTVYLMLRE